MQHIAINTLQAIEQALDADKCGQFRQNLEMLLPKMEDAYRGTERPYRRHLGASMIGRECARELQLNWLWAAKPSFNARLLRLFNRGHLEEARFLSMLMCVPGVQLWYETEDGGQFKWSDFGGHFGSALDGIALGIPDVPAGAACYTEFKTANDKSFKKLQANGVRAEKWEHFVQMQQCMQQYKLPYSLYMCVNKNDDELYAEIIEYDQEYADRYRNRAGEIIFTSEPVVQISQTPTYFKCRFCNYKDVCHGKTAPDVNCRTCAHFSANSDGTYSCAIGNNALLASDESYVGCSSHVYNPTLLKGISYIGGTSGGRGAEYVTRSGERIVQGEGGLDSHTFKAQYDAGNLR